MTNYEVKITHQTNDTEGGAVTNSHHDSRECEEVIGFIEKGNIHQDKARAVILVVSPSKQ